MTDLPAGSDPERETRRRIIRRATQYTIGFFLAALAIAALGSALVAWLLTVVGLPFLETWIVITALVLAVPLIGFALAAVRRRRRHGTGGG